MTRKQIKEQAARYAKFVEWSDEDQCFIGSCPKIMVGSVHGSDKARVGAELCEVVEDWVELLFKDGVPLPDPSTAKSSSDKFVPRIGPPIHRRLNANDNKRHESLIRQGYSNDDANLLVQMASVDIAKNGRVFLNPITMSFNLESGVVSNEELESAKQIITDGLNLLRQIHPAQTPTNPELVAEWHYAVEKFSAELLKRPALKLPKETTKLPQPNQTVALLYGETIPFVWAIKPFTRDKHSKAETLLGLKSVTGLEKVISRVFPKNDASRILEAKTLTAQEAALLLIDCLRRRNSQTSKATAARQKKRGQQKKRPKNRS